MIRGVAAMLNSLATVARTGLYSDLVGCPSVPTMVQRIRAQTNTSGIYTWTYPVAYGSGVTPIVQVTVEDTGAGVFQHKVTNISNTSVTIQLAKNTVATILGIDVLSVSSNPQAFIHLTSMSP